MPGFLNRRELIVESSICKDQQVLSLSDILTIGTHKDSGSGQTTLQEPPNSVEEVVRVTQAHY